MSTFEKFLDGLDFGEGPRWHDGRLWYSDFFQHQVYAVSSNGERETILDLGDEQPSGLGWLPDGSLLVVGMTRRQVLRATADGDLSIHADLSGVAAWHCNDMVVDARGNAYVGNFGFDLENRASPASADLALVRADGSVEVAAEGLGFPNGSVITPDGSTLIVGETMAQCYTAFTIGDDGSLSERRTWAEVQGTAPDGCSLDDNGAIWFANAAAPEVVRVAEGGEILERRATPQSAFACILGGEDGRTLFVLTSPGFTADSAGSAAGAIWTTRVDSPGAGLP
ncbi:MAG: SMP-30/gluconolactonase/LRE family protein [Actinomycetota bacterium]|nr:SMP-30/gluconolactonase/LRE family protein [Actinomycetota bacterium]